MNTRLLSLYKKNFVFSPQHLFKITLSQFYFSLLATFYFTHLILQKNRSTLQSSKSNYTENKCILNSMRLINWIQYNKTLGVYFIHVADCT